MNISQLRKFYEDLNSLQFVKLLIPLFGSFEKTIPILELFAGTTSHVLVYHVHDNKDIFYKECTDGVKALTLGNFGETRKKILLVGGNSSIHGYDHDGNEVFWTTVGDVITSMILMDFNKDSSEEVNKIIFSEIHFSMHTYFSEKNSYGNTSSFFLGYVLNMLAIWNIRNIW